MSLHWQYVRYTLQTLCRFFFQCFSLQIGHSFLSTVRSLALALTAMLALVPASAQSGPAIFTVTTLVDDTTGTAANCNQTQNGAAPPLPNCNLRDAFAAVAALGSPASAPTINFASTLHTSTGTITPSAGNPATYTLRALPAPWSPTTA